MRAMWALKFMVFIVLVLGVDAVAEPRPAVLFVDAKPEQVRSWEDWLEAGFEVDAKALAEVGTLESLKPYNVVIVNFLPSVDAQLAIQPEQARFEVALGAFLREGGGALVFSGGSGFENILPALQHLLKAYGATVPEEQVTDAEHSFGKVGTFRGCYTTQIAAAPMTQGISRLGFVADATRADCIETTMPLVILEKDAWQVVVRGESSAYSAEGISPGSSSKLKDTPATYATSPVMAAWRTVGAGRLLAYPHNPAFTTASPEVFAKVLWNAADQSEPGAMQNRTFIMQAARWAAEPSMTAGNFGGFLTDRELRPDQRAILGKRETAIDWSQVGSGDALAPAMHKLPGLIGAQSNFSGGERTVAQLCEAARAAGLSYLGFTENLEQMTAVSWAALIAECEANSSEDFLAIPGLLALDLVGNSWFALGWAPFPQPQSVSEDLSRIENTYMFWSKLFQGRMAGFVRTGLNPNPWYEMKHSSTFAVSSWEGGEEVDNALDAFLQSCAAMENYIPLRFTLLRNESELAAAAAGPLNIYTGPNVQDLRLYAEGREPHKRNLFWASPHNWYLGNGPTLAYHGGHNLGNLATDEELDNRYRYGFKLEGMQPGDRVLLYDGTRIFREWRAEEGTFVGEHDWPHEQVRQFVIRVMRGEETVLLSAPLQLHYGRRFMQCGDRQNTLPYNYQPDRHGNTYVSGIPIGAHYRSWPPQTLVYGNFKIWLTGAIGIEYQPPMYMSFMTSPEIPFEHERQEGSRNLASYQYPRLSCPGMLIVDQVTDRVYPDGGRNTGDCTPPKLTEPLQLFNLHQRRYAIYGALDQVNAQYVESRVVALRDVNLAGSSPQVLVSRISFPIDPEAGQMAELTVGDRLERLPLDALPRVNYNDLLAAGDYVGVYPHGLAGGGAQYKVSGDLVSRLQTSKTDNLTSAWYLRVPAQWSKDQEFSYSLLYSTGGSKPHRPASDYVKTAAFLGLRDKAFPAIAAVKGGELLAEPVIATIVTTPEATVELTTRHDPEAPVGLPIRLRGLQPNWQVAYQLNGSTIWRYCGEYEGDFYLNLYTHHGAHQLTAGHPVTASDDRLRIALDDATGGQTSFELYNPTAEAITASLRPHAPFLTGEEKSVTVAPYTSATVQWSKDQ